MAGKRTGAVVHAETDLSARLFWMWMEGEEMLTDPGSIDKVRGAMAKLDDVEAKICDVRLATSTEVQDKAICIEAIDLAAAAKMALSQLVPPVVP